MTTTQAAAWSTPLRGRTIRATVQATVAKIPRARGEALPGDVYFSRPCIAYDDTCFALMSTDDDLYLDALARRLEAL